LLGDVTPSKPRKWYNGDSVVPYPPAILLNCNEQDAQDKVLVGGFDSRCWTLAGEAIPDQIPRIWFRPETLDSYIQGQPVPTWKDSSSYTNDCVNVGGGFPPRMATFPPYDCVMCDKNHVLNEVPAITFCSAWTAIIVMMVPEYFTGVPFNNKCCGAGLNLYMLDVEPNQIGWRDNLGHGTWNTLGNYNNLIVWTIRRKPQYAEAWRNNTYLGIRGAGLNAPRGRLPLLNVTPLSDYVITRPVPIFKQSAMFEAKIFDGAISDSQLLAERTFMVAKYTGTLIPGGYFTPEFFANNFYNFGYWE